MSHHQNHLSSDHENLVSPPAPDSDALAQMGRYLTLFALQKNKTGPTTTYEIMQQDKIGNLQNELDTDKLTGVLSRQAVEQRLQNILDIPDQNPDRYIFMYLDLDGFKHVNDTKGHKAGDKVLKSVGNRIGFRDTDIVGRLGGDEFVVIVDTEMEAPDRRGSSREESTTRRTPKTRDEVIEGLVNHVRSEVKQAGLDADQTGIGVSIGVIEVNGYETAQEIIDAADAAMYQDKTNKDSR